VPHLTGLAEIPTAVGRIPYDVGEQHPHLGATTMDPASTLEAVRDWPVDDRLDLVFRLWDQLGEDGWQPEPNEELIAELDARLQRHEADPTNVRTWEQIEERLRNEG
jgi:putative addiction module component (TIGR02574 family)